MPRIDIPLHTVMELVPKADGTMAETRFHVDVDRALRETGFVDLARTSSTAASIRSEFTSDEEERTGLGGLGAGDGEEGGLDAGREAAGGAGTGQGFRRSISMAELAAAEVVTTRKMLLDEQQ